MGEITVVSATAIAVGGMMGAGLYTLVGLASTAAGVWVPVAFLVGGAVTAFSVYSYAKLGARFPSRGGAAQFLIRCFGDGAVTRICDSPVVNVFTRDGSVPVIDMWAGGVPLRPPSLRESGVHRAAAPAGVTATVPRQATCPTRTWFGPRGCPFGQQRRRTSLPEDFRPCRPST